MKMLLATTLLAFGLQFAFAQGEEATAYPVLNFHNAIAICPVPNNPLYNGLYKLGGHVLTQEKLVETINPVTKELEVIMTAKAMWTPRIFNTRIMAPDRLVGEIQLVVGYNNGMLFCQLMAKPFQK